jgi:CBS domain-containing protein
LTETITQPATQPDAKQAGRTSTGMSRLELRTTLARTICGAEPPMVGPQTPLAGALHAMREHGGEALLVGEDGRLAGILTERDVLHRVIGQRIDPARPVSDFMTPEPHALDAAATLLDAMQAMESGGYRNLPLVEDGRVIGLLRQHDLLHYIAEAFPQEILNLPPRPHQTMEEPEGA